MIIKYSFQANERYSFDQNATAVYRSLFQSPKRSNYPDDLGLTFSFSLNLNIISHYFQPHMTNTNRQVKGKYVLLKMKTDIP